MIAVRRGYENIVRFRNQIALGIKDHARVVPHGSSRAPGMRHGGIAAEISTNTRNGERQMFGAPRGSEVVSRPTGIRVVHIQSVGLSGARRGTICDLEGLRIWCPLRRGPHASEGPADSTGGRIDVENLSHLVVDQYRLVVWCHSQHYARDIRILAR